MRKKLIEIIMFLTHEILMERQRDAQNFMRLKSPALKYDFIVGALDLSMYRPL